MSAAPLPSKQVLISTPSASSSPTTITRTTETTALVVPKGTVIVQQPYVWTNEFFETQGRTASDLLSLNLPKSEGIEWSIEARPPKANAHLALKANITKTIAAIRRTATLQYTYQDYLVQLSGGNVSSVLVSKSNLYLPGVDVDIGVSAPTITPSAAIANLTAKLRPLGLSTNLDYDIQTGLISGWFALYHGVQLTQNGNKIGVGGRGDFIGNTLKSAQLAGVFKRNTFEAVASLTLTNLRTKPSLVSASLLETLQVSGRAYDVAGRVEHNLENERTAVSVAVLDRELNAKLRLNTNGLLGVASTHTFGGGLLQLTVGLDFDLLKKDAASSLKLVVV